jgi:Asparaginase
MRKHVGPFIAAVVICITCSCSQPAPPAQAQSAPAAAPSPPKWGMVIHTGAGITLAGIAERKDAMQAAMNDTLKPIGGEGGVIGLDARGNVTMSFNTTGMGRGYVGADGKPTIMFTADDGK